MFRINIFFGLQVDTLEINC